MHRLNIESMTVASKKKKTAAKGKVAKKKKLPKGKSAPKKKKKPSLPKRDSKGRFLPKPKPTKPIKAKAKKKKKKVKPRAKPLPIREPRPEPRERRPRVRKPKRSDIWYIQVGNYEDYSTATHLKIDSKLEHYKNFSHLTRSDINATLDTQTATIATVFDKALEGHLNKMSIEYEDIRIFSYGVLLRPDGAELTQSLVSEIAIILQGFNPQIVIGVEQDGQEALLINFGYEDRRLSAMTVYDRIDARSYAMQQVYMLLYDELGVDIDWSVWWDTDEMMY